MSPHLLASHAIPVVSLQRGLQTVFSVLACRLPCLSHAATACWATLHRCGRCMLGHTPPVLPMHAGPHPTGVADACLPALLWPHHPSPAPILRCPQVRVVLEKPLGHDLASNRAINETVRRVLAERQIFRIDHFLGKEAVQNLLYFRFANSIIEPLWNRTHIEHVQITMAESIGVEGLPFTTT